MPDRMRELTPYWMHGALDWIIDSTVLGTLAFASLAMFVLSVAGIPWFVTRVPADYFARPDRKLFSIDHHPPAWRTTLRVAKNLLGAVLMVLGIAMLVLPGQGLVTMALALVLLDFPGKFRLERRIVSWPPILRAFNAIRRRAGQEPLEVPHREAT